MMEVFLTKISKIIEQLYKNHEVEDVILQELKYSYKNLTEEEKKKSIDILAEILQDDYASYFYIMSALLTELKSGIIVPYIEKMLASDIPTLWERISNMYQLKGLLFRQAYTEENYIDKNAERQVYEKILKDIYTEIGVTYDYIPYSERKKRVILICRQFLRQEHAPSKIIMKIYKYLEQLGYDVLVYVCFHPWEDGTGTEKWYNGHRCFNFLENKTTGFSIDTSEMTLEGYNLCLNQNNYLNVLRAAMGLIWEQKPEFILEIGDKTLLAGLCKEFVTLATMGCTKAVPITNAHILVRYMDYSKKEDEEYRLYVDKQQCIVDIKYEIDEIRKNKSMYKKEDFGIESDTFVITIVGNRLDTEISEEFLNIIYHILKFNSKIVVVIIGECELLKTRVFNDGYEKQILFLGFQQNLKEVIGIGDIFLNPPRKGAGTSALYAILENIPIITLKNCDVASTAGQEFVCDSIEEMVSLIQKYFLDQDFMQVQKQNCENRIESFKNIDSVENFRKLTKLVRELTLEKEKKDYER